MNNLVSIIIPLYNKEQYIGRCLDSLINQSYRNIEIIVVDDGSIDDGYNIVKKYNDKRIKLFKKNNSGVSDTRNFGIKESAGKYICFVDADDYVEKDYILSLINSFDKDLELVVCGYKYIHNNSNSYENNGIDYEGNIKNVPNIYYIKGYFHPVWGKMYLSKIVKNNSLRFKKINISEDSFFNLEYLKYCKNIKIISDSNYFYVQYKNGQNLTSFSKFNYLNIYTELYDELNLFIGKELACEIIYPQYYNLILKLVKNNSVFDIRNNNYINDNFTKIKQVMLKHKCYGNESIIKQLIIYKKWKILKLVLSSLISV